MKKLILGAVLVVFALTANAQNDWENPEIFQVGTEPSRASFWRGGITDCADWNISLNGQWKFKYVHEAADRPMNFYEQGYNTSEWDNIEVPGPWELQGFGTPI